MSHAGYNTPLDCQCDYCELRPIRYFTQKGWDNMQKFDTKRKINGEVYYRDIQEELCKKFKVTFTDYIDPKTRKKIKWQTRWIKIKSILYRIKRFLNDQHEKNQKRAKPKNRSPFFENLTMSERDYKNITGRTTNEDLSFITGRNKRQDMSFITGKQRRDYSALTGKKKSTPKFDMGKRNYSGLIGSRKKIKL